MEPPPDCHGWNPSCSSRGVSSVIMHTSFLVLNEINFFQIKTFTHFSISFSPISQCRSPWSIHVWPCNYTTPHKSRKHSKLINNIDTWSLHHYFYNSFFGIWSYAVFLFGIFAGVGARNKSYSWARFVDQRCGGFDGAIALHTSFKTVGGVQIGLRCFLGLTEFPQPHQTPVSLTFGFFEVKLRNGFVFGPWLRNYFSACWFIAHLHNSHPKP